MDFLFPDLVIPELAPFRQPTRSEAADWLRQTGGVWINDILRWLGRPTRSDRDIAYRGALTPSQQWWIICDLQDQT
jgi:hypothetical protein